MYVHASMYTYVCIYAYMCIYIHLYAYVCVVHVSEHVCMHVYYVCVYVCTCMCVCVYRYVCIMGDIPKYCDKVILRKISRYRILYRHCQISLKINLLDIVYISGLVETPQCKRPITITITSSDVFLANTFLIQNTTYISH